jgi:hypothetical protein
VAIVTQWHGNNVSMATNECTTVEEPLEAMPFTWSVPRLYNVDKLVDSQLEVGVSGLELHF